MLRNRTSLLASGRPSRWVTQIHSRSIFISSRQPKRQVSAPVAADHNDPMSAHDRFSVLGSFANELDDTIARNLHRNPSSSSSSSSSFPLSHSSSTSSKSSNRDLSAASALFLQSLKQGTTLSPSSSVSQGRRRRRRPTLIDHQRAKELDRQIKQVEQYANNLKHQIRMRDERALQLQKLQEETAKYEKSETNVSQKALSEVSSDADKLMDFLDLPENEAHSQLAQSKSPAPSSLKDVKTSMFDVPTSAVKLPPTILNRIGHTVTAIASESHQDWSRVVAAIFNNPNQLSGVSSDEVSLLMQQIPLAQRAKVLPLLHEMIWDAQIPLTKYIYDTTIAAYAEQGNTALVQVFMDQMNADNITPDHYTYGNLVKCMAKNRDLEGAVKVTKEMQAKHIALSVPIYTTLLQTCINVGDYNQAFDVFDMLKFLGTEMQPDVPVYNSVMLAAAKQQNVNRVLDLYNEMTTRAIDPLRPDANTYSVLIYACARDEKTHIKAWHLLLEMQERGFAPDRSTLNVMLYLCGKTGELAFARSIFRQMCTDKASYPDAFALNCLLDAYANYKPGFFSPILSTALGTKLRAAFFYNLDIAASTPAEITPPFLPAPMLANKLQVLAESRAVYTFFRDMQFNTSETHERARKMLNPETGSVRFINERTTLTYLRVPANLGNEAEFNFRWINETCIKTHMEKGKRILLPYKDTKQQEEQTLEQSSEPQNTLEQELTKTPRNHYMYDLAIRTATKNSWPYKSVRSIWESRGEWRRSPQSTYWATMSDVERRRSDFLFARGMVEYLAHTRKLFDAVDIVQSSVKLFRWRKVHLVPIIDAAREIEDESTLRKIKKILASYHQHNDEI
ncbi:uncharacterized protein SAPINGB_P003077 [Magnusiomyces paraingens]|uniref:PROP1-like PPR domain-containing protein n=1 Tax=Magnusiomyces paraingens TaxID=2606893 RepID=A0A5E8BJF7_9ASCO|nr:uncharacterized protein SAPINGB_P003077 [Saprochaete ingens]VVT51381.1 unnamed protein product [Saprochaete ingens]